MSLKYHHAQILLVFFVLLHFSPPIFATRILYDGSPSSPPSFKWRERTLKYAFLQENPIDYLSQEDIDMAFSRAFATWSSVIPVSFEKVDNLSSADAVIGFFQGNPADEELFKTGELAHAWPPPNGLIAVDTNYRWSFDFNKDKSKDAYDLESIAVHEIGHVLGLGHTFGDKRAIMYPVLYPRTKRVRLTIADAKLVNRVYGIDPNFDLSSLYSSGWSILKEGPRFSGRLIMPLAAIIIMI